MNWKDVLGRLRVEEGKKLQHLAADKTVLEIGSLFGRSTICLAEVAKIVHAVDPHRPNNTNFCDEFRGRDSLQELRVNLRRAGVEGKVILYIGTVDNLWKPTGAIFDLAFIDGSHRRDDVTKDLTFVAKYLSSKGIIACHDYDDEEKHAGVAQAVNAFDGWRILERVASLAILTNRRGE